jgi:Tol biopolymer transport system component
VPGVTAGNDEVYVKDLQTGAVSLVSANPDGSPLNQCATNPRISADGRLVVFEEYCRSPDVLLVKDRQTGTLRRVNEDAAGTRANYYVTFSPGDVAISADGTTVAFRSRPDQRGNDPLDAFFGENDILVKSLVTGELRLGSGTAAGASADAESGDVSLSANGRYLAFATTAANLGTAGAQDANVFVKDLQTGALVHADVRPDGSDPDDYSFTPSLSGDGRYVAFTSRSDFLEPSLDDGDTLFVRDLQTGAVGVGCGTDVGGPPSDDCEDAHLSGDGRFAVFRYDGTDLVPGVPGGLSGMLYRTRNPLVP